MKKLLLLPFLFSLSAAAQNWSPINLTDKYNYRLDNDAVITQTIWQTNYSVNGSDTTFSFNKTFCDTCVTIVGGPDPNCDTCYAQNNLPRFFGFSLVKNSSGWCNFRNPVSKTINIFSALNDSWLFDTTSNITAQVIFTGNSLVLGNSDSVKTLLLSSGDTVQFSKNYGITQWPNGYGQNSYYRLVGIHGRNIGQLVPRVSDYYNFNVGDMFEYHSRSNPGDGYSTAVVYDCERKYTITSRQVNGDTTTYHTNGAYLVDWTNYSLWTNGQFSGILNYDIVVIDSAAHLGNQFNGDLVESEGRIIVWWAIGPVYGGGLNSSMGGTFAGARLFVDSLGVESMGMGRYGDVSFSDLMNFSNSYFFQYSGITPGSDTLYNTLQGGAPTNIVVLKKGLGQVAGYYDCHFECSYYEHLEAYRKGNDTVGVFTTDSVLLGVADQTSNGTTVDIYPNPANDFINVKTDVAEETIFSLLDLQGRIVKSLNSKTGVAQISVADLASGMYILRVATSKGISQQKVMVNR